MTSTIKTIGIMTSGGDSPGMNAAIRAITRTALSYNLNVVGIKRGYQGMIDNEMINLSSIDVSNIIQRGGTILKTARSKDFETKSGRALAFENIKKHNIDALVLIGGDGTMRGAEVFFNEYQIPAVGLPGTIDNDLVGSDFTIGFDTAVNTAIEAIDKIRDTASAHNRIFIIEVMGRDAGYIALHAGISCGAEHIFIPELSESINDFILQINNDQERKKLSNIIIVSEGDEIGGGLEVFNLVKEKIPKAEVRLTILGHIQRGGNPTANDRVLASRLGYNAVLALLENKKQVMVGVVNNEIAYTPFSACTKTHTVFSKDLQEIIKVLSK
ncbi:MAG: 6-phosphofructokinase [Chitinophagaceae bacterium]|nr:6-phosphofructokinase [Chitinophagaceae bacterium]